MFRTLSITGALVALCLAGSGCVVSGQVRSSAYVSTPDLVLVEPGVYVVADYSEPVFYTNGYYWLYRDGYWLRSYTYSGGWVSVRSVPYGVRRIHRPYAYRHYRPSARARVYRPSARRGAPPQRVHYRSNVRDHRYDRRDNRYERRDNRRPDVRDHRSDRRYDRRDDRRDNRAERRDNRSDNRKERRDNRKERSRDRRDRD
jgi:hypothetical protein